MRMLKYLAVVLWITGCASVVRGDNTAGVGLVLGMDGEHIVVRGILSNSPAATQKTIRIGDRILTVAQGSEAPVQLQGMELAQAVSLVRGSIGTTVRLTIVRSGEDDSQARVVTFVRGELKQLARWGDGVLLTNGVKAPDIEMVGLPTGSRERLLDYSGKIVVLEFWATWCGPCQPKMAQLQGYPEEYPDWKGNVVLIAASLDDSEDAPTKHLKTKGWNETHNVWVGVEAIKAYHIAGIPTAYIIDRQGRIVAANPISIPDIVNSQLHQAGPTEAK